MSNPDIERKTREQILQTCLELVREEGFDSITVRRIASKAGVNVALINYYFGTKDKLINEVVRLIVSGFMESFRTLREAGLSPRQKVKKFFLGYAVVIQKYRDVVLRIISGKPGLTDSQYEYLGFLKLIGYDEIKSLLRELTGEVKEERLFMMMLQIGGAIIGPMMIYPFFSTVLSDIPELDENTLSNYIDSFLDLYLSKYINRPKEDSAYAAGQRDNRVGNQGDV